MKVSNNKDPGELTNVHRSKRGEKAAAANSSTSPTSTAPAGAAVDPASISISSEAKAMSAATQIARADDTDQAKIDRIKAMINGGTYKPDFGKVAEKMVNEQVLQELS